jgi:hypothetical protein
MLINNAIVTGSLVVTGNSVLSGSLAISGSINTTGNITATTLVVQTITSSISSITGSTNFGSISSNTHQFTGSVLISGSSTALNVNNGAFFISSSGNIGIGTTTPEGPLHINKSNSAGYVGMIISNPVSVTNTSVGIDFGVDVSTSYNGTGNAQIKVINTNSADNRADITFSTYNGSTFGERMRITSAGIVTAPSQVSFKAYLTGANPELTKGANSTIPYNNEEYDVQSNFSQGTYRFTAPVAGKYLFTVNTNMYGVDDAAQIRISLFINSSSSRTLYWIQNAPTGNTGDCNLSGSDILNLASGATVEVRIYTDGSGTYSLSAGLDYNSFSGHLLG